MYSLIWKTLLTASQNALGHGLLEITGILEVMIPGGLHRVHDGKERPIGQYWNMLCQSIPLYSVHTVPSARNALPTLSREHPHLTSVSFKSLLMYPLLSDAFISVLSPYVLFSHTPWLETATSESLVCTSHQYIMLFGWVLDGWWAEWFARASVLAMNPIFSWCSCLLHVWMLSLWVKAKWIWVPYILVSICGRQKMPPSKKP